MFKNMDFDEVEDVTDLLETDEGFSSSDAFKNKQKFPGSNTNSDPPGSKKEEASN